MVPDSEDAGKLIEMMLLVLMETVGRGTVSGREELGCDADLLTTLGTSETMGDEAMDTEDGGWETTSFTFTGKDTAEMLAGAEVLLVDITGVTDGIEFTWDKETATVALTCSGLAACPKLGKDDICGVETASNLVTVAEGGGGVDLTKEAGARVVGVSGLSLLG